MPIVQDPSPALAVARSPVHSGLRCMGRTPEGHYRHRYRRRHRRCLRSHPGATQSGVRDPWRDYGLGRHRIARATRGASACRRRRKKIPVLAGVPTHSKSEFSQRAWAVAGPAAAHGNAVDFLLPRQSVIRTRSRSSPLVRSPMSGQPSPAIHPAFRLLDRVVLMGGSVHCGYGNPRAIPPPPPQAEYNIAMDPGAARKLFASGVPIFMMPLDSTQWKLDDGKLAQIAARSTPSTDALLVLTTEWRLSTHQHVPTLFDAMAVTYALRPISAPPHRFAFRSTTRASPAWWRARSTPTPASRGTATLSSNCCSPACRQKTCQDLVIVFVITPVATHVTPLARQDDNGRVREHFSRSRVCLQRCASTCPEPTADIPDGTQL